MAHNWKVYGLTRTTSTGVVSKVTYGCELDEGIHSARQVADLEISGSSEDEGFIAFDSLTEENILVWVFAAADKAAIEASLTAEIVEFKALAAGNDEAQGLPW
jgi:hypothetical protein|tara:strand:+ start:2679 stop:2987 length:309 start_codon:yes stop_codon:yes gene_type:complete